MGWLTVLFFIGLAFQGGCSPPENNTWRVIYTGSLDGYLEPCGCKEGKVGGLARLAGGIQDSLQRWKDDALLVDAGDFAETYAFPGDPKNRFLLEAYHSMGYDAINVTAQDLICGFEVLQRAADSLGLPLISANLTVGDSTQHPLPGWVIKKVNHKAIGVIGIGSLRPLEMRLSGDPTLKFSDPEPAIRRALEQVRSQCDIVILLSDLNSRASRELAAKIPGLDVIISTLEVTPTSFIRKFGYAYVAGTSRRGKALTILTLRQILGDSLACGFSRTLLDSTFRSEAKVEKVVAEYRRVKPQNETPVTRYGGEE